MNKRPYSLNGLRMFEAAARRLSFTLAAEELNVSQAAVSQQIRRLEEQLDVQFFIRKSRGLSLSSAGHELAETTRVALNSIQKSVDHITGADSDSVLTISTLASFASRWLIPRLSRFHDDHRDIELHVHSSGRKANFSRDGIDAAIRLGALKESGLKRNVLMNDALCLIATPDLATKITATPDDIYQTPFIIDGARLFDENKIDTTGAATDRALGTMNFDRSKLDILIYEQSDSVVLAAIAGQGVALTRLSLCVDDLEAGRLKIVCNYCAKLDYGYSLMYLQSRATDPKLVAFSRWLSGEVDEFVRRMERYITT